MFFLPAYVAQEAQQDSWLSVIIGTLSSMLVILLFLALGLRYRDKLLYSTHAIFWGNLWESL
jgi:spore germination protein KB